jgi:hypothetical protein
MPLKETRETRPTAVHGVAGSSSRMVLVALAVAALGAAGFIASRRPVGRRAIAAFGRRWREMHTPGSGRERVLPPDVPEMVAAMQKARVRTFRFTALLGNTIEIAPFLVEASWPAECRLADENVVGYASELRSRTDCSVIDVTGELALAHCHL